MVNEERGVSLDPLQAGERRPVGREVSLHLRDVMPVAGGHGVPFSALDVDASPSPVNRRVFDAYVEVARQMTAYLAARPR
jgi:hypothetical protein